VCGEPGGIQNHDRGHVESSGIASSAVHECKASHTSLAATMGLRHTMELSTWTPLRRTNETAKVRWARRWAAA
jgi:hypothetical protein